ncbi:MAG: glycosyltransferase family 2 protein, partial [Lachnospiraceae bacterium]|nr:glycosyltransferase family 2 protein [Lachnospiraceae bacterium]
MINVIIPVYNIQKEYLKRCIDSVLAQTYKDIEIILVDDGSSDGSGDVCDEYASLNANVKAFHKENGGSSSARNIGIKEASGEYIGFVDSDDYIEPDMYEVLYEAIVRNNAKCAQVGRNEIDEEGNILP